MQRRVGAREREGERTADTKNPAPAGVFSSCSFLFYQLWKQWNPATCFPPLSPGLGNHQVVEFVAKWLSAYLLITGETFIARRYPSGANWGYRPNMLNSSAPFSTYIQFILVKSSCNPGLNASCVESCGNVLSWGNARPVGRSHPVLITTTVTKTMTTAIIHQKAVWESRSMCCTLWRFVVAWAMEQSGASGYRENQNSDCVEQKFRKCQTAHDWTNTQRGGSFLLTCWVQHLPLF